MKKFVKVLLAAAVIGGVGFGIYSLLDTSVSVKTVKAESGVFEDRFTEKGTIKSGNDINCISEVSGTLLSVKAKKNQHIQKGDVIATIDTSDYENEKQQHFDTIASLQTQINSAKQNEGYDKADMRNSIKELEVELDSIENARKKAKVANTMETSPQTYLNNLKTNVETAEKNVKTAEASLASAENKVTSLTESTEILHKDYMSKKTLYDNGVISKNEFDIAQREYNDSAADLEDAKTELNTAKTNLNEAHNSLNSAQTAYDDALSRTDANETDDKYYGYTDKDFDIQEASVRAKISALEAKLSNDYSSLMAEDLQKQIDSEQKAIDRLDKKIEKCTVKAVCDGLITDLPAENMTTISEGTVVAVIKSDSALTAEADVLTGDIPYLNTGDSAVVIQRLKNDKKEFSGTISEIYDYAEKGTSALGTDEYRTKVIVALDDADADLKAGYEVELKFIAYHSDNALTIPNSAVFKVDDTDCVYIKKGGKAVLTNVKIAYKGNTDTEISDGVSAGDTVIYDADVEGLTDGVKISEE